MPVSPWLGKVVLSQLIKPQTYQPMDTKEAVMDPTSQLSVALYPITVPRKLVRRVFLSLVISELGRQQRK